MKLYRQWTEALKRIKPRCQGMIFVGANTGQELEGLVALGFRHVLVFEPLPQLTEPLTAHCASLEKKYPGVKLEVFPVALGSAKASSEIYVASNGGASSSLLRPADHVHVFPQISFESKVKVEVVRMDEVFAQYNLDPSAFNTVVMDTQGYEMEVLKGAGSLLDGIDVVVTEISTAELYEGTPLVGDIDRMLTGKGFTKMWSYLHPGLQFGDAIYTRFRAPILARVDVLKAAVLVANLPGRIWRRLLRIARLR